MPKTMPHGSRANATVATVGISAGASSTSAPRLGHRVAAGSDIVDAQGALERVQRETGRQLPTALQCADQLAVEEDLLEARRPPRPELPPEQQLVERPG